MVYEWIVTDIIRGILMATLIAFCTSQIYRARSKFSLKDSVPKLGTSRSGSRSQSPSRDQGIIVKSQINLGLSVALTLNIIWTFTAHDPYFTQWEVYTVLSSVTNGILVLLGLRIVYLMAQAEYGARNAATSMPYAAAIMVTAAGIVIFVKILALILLLVTDNRAYNAVRHLASLTAAVVGTIYLEYAFISVYRELSKIVNTKTKPNGGSMSHQPRRSLGSVNMSTSKHPSRDSRMEHINTSTSKHQSRDSRMEAKLSGEISNEAKARRGRDRKRSMNSFDQMAGVGAGRENRPARKRGNTKLKRERVFTEDVEHRQKRGLRKLLRFLVMVPIVGALMILALTLVVVESLRRDGSFREEIEHDASTYNWPTDAAQYIIIAVCSLFAYYANSNEIDNFFPKFCC
ncbi:hypothetical protein AAMO2058_001433900 [Amorphochlora amoebiformis]